MKHCNTCGKTKPFSEFYFRRAENRHRAQCKTCEVKARLRHRRSVRPGRVMKPKPPPTQFICRGPDGESGCFGMAHRVRGRVCEYCGLERRPLKVPTLERATELMRRPEVRMPA